jgi:hypothetical protein
MSPTYATARPIRCEGDRSVADTANDCRPEIIEIRAAVVYGRNSGETPSWS